MSSELNYTIDELFDKTPEWIGLVYNETIKQVMAKNGVESEIKLKAKEGKLINSRKVLDKLGLGMVKRQK